MRTLLSSRLRRRHARLTAQIPGAGRRSAAPRRLLPVLAALLLRPVSAAAAQAFQESGGQVVMEAERYDTKVPRGGRDWAPETSRAGYAGGGYLTCLPNGGTTINSGYVTTSPELVYNVQFSTTGTYYVWIRGWGASGNDDSVHAGIDNTGPASADKITYFPASWTWSRTTSDASAPATLTITTPGLHTIHLWMREDGMSVDRLLLRTSSSATAPSGAGPAESPQIPLGTTTAMALDFNGTTQYGDVGNPAALQMTGAMSLCAWVRIDSLASAGRIIAKQGSSSARGWSLNVESSGVAAFQIAANATTLKSVNAPVATGAWTHLVGVYDPAVPSLTLYVNATAAPPVTIGVPTAQHNSALNVNIGRRPNNCCYFDGRIDEVRVYNRALTAAEVAAHYSGGLGQHGQPESGLVAGWHFNEGSGNTAADYSGNNLTANLFNTPAWVAGHVQLPPVGGAPSVTGLTPATGTKLLATTSIALLAEASDPDGQALQRQFLLDGVVLPGLDWAPGLTGAWTPTLSQLGLHQLEVRVRDAGGNVAGKQSQIYVIRPPVPSP